MLSNRQIFTNLVYPIEFSKDVTKTGHHISSIQIDHASPILFLFVVLAIVMLIIFVKTIIENFCFSSSQDEELLGIEELYSFYSSLYKSDIEYWVCEETQIRNNFVSINK